MRENKGFTLVEMLGVLIILIVVFMIMFPSLTKIIKDTNDKIDNATITVIEDATTDFLLEKNDIYPKNDDYTYCITIEQLIDNGNLTNKEISSLDDTDKFVKTTFENGKSVYVLTDTCTVSKPNIEFALIGNNNMSFEVGVGGQYVEPGANAKNKAGEVVSYVTEIINKNKVTVAYVDTTKIGIYTIKYSATIDGKDYAIERIVKVIDTTAPTITVSPATETISITNSTYNVLSGVTAADNSGETPKIIVSSNLSLGQSGTYTITYTVEDSSGNKQTTKRKVNISNSTLVNVSLNGDNVVNVSGNYLELGATAIDKQGNDLSADLIRTIINNGKIVDEVKVDVKTAYYITYSILKDGVTYSETRTVNILDIVPPTVVFSINGSSTYAKSRSTTVTVNDESGIDESSLKYQWTTSSVAPTEGSFTSTFINGGTIQSPTNVTGGYYLWILAKDSSGNKLITKSNVFNLDNTPPVIVLTSTGGYYISGQFIYVATATDNIDGNITNRVVARGLPSNPSSPEPGNYSISYSVLDSAGNESTTSSFNITITPSLPPGAD